MCVCVIYIFFIHSSVDGHLGCFPVLAVADCSSAGFYLFFTYFYSFIFQRLSAREWGRGAKGERERENPKQAACSVRSPVRGLIP